MLVSLFNLYIVLSQKRKLKAAAECSSSVDKTSTSGTEETHMTENSSLEEESRPAIKRKLDATDAGSDYGPIELNVPLHVDNIIGADLDGVLCGDIDHGLGDLDDLNIDDYVGTESLDAPKLCPGLSTDMPPVDDDSIVSPAFAQGSFILLILLRHILLSLMIYSFISRSFAGIEDVPVVDKGLLVQTAAPTMDVITEFFMNATESALKAALDGLDASTIVEPRRQAILQDLLRMIPSIPQFASVREAVERLISISVGMQEANGGVGAMSAKQIEAIAKAESEVASYENALKATSDKLLSAIDQNDERKRLVTSLSFKLNEATSALLRSEEEVTRLNLEHSDKQSEAKRLRDVLHEVKSKATEEVEALKDKTLELGNEAGLIFQTLKSWPSVPIDKHS